MIVPPSCPNNLLDAPLDVPINESVVVPISSNDSTLQFRLHSVSQLTDELRADWNLIRSSAAHYRSPFFSYEFVEAVGALIPNVELAIAQRAGRVVAILPFQRIHKWFARPVGAGINDAHGLLALQDMDFEFTDLLAAVKLKSFSFHASPPAAPGVSSYEMGRKNSFLADLMVDPMGYEHFLRSRNTTIDRQGQKTRHLIRDLGPLGFEFDCRDPNLIKHFLALKQEQYQRTHTFDILSVPWIQQLLFQLHQQTCGPHLRGLLSVLYAGSTPVALHYGMLERDWLHYWFPVFDPSYAYGSPGTQLFLEVARAAREQGVVAIDMGYGEQAYKHKLTNVLSEMSYGVLDPNPLRRAMHKSSLALSQRLKGVKLRERIKPFLRKLMPGIGKGDYCP